MELLGVFAEGYNYVQCSVTSDCSACRQPAFTQEQLADRDPVIADRTVEQTQLAIDPAHLATVKLSEHSHHPRFVFLELGVLGVDGQTIIAATTEVSVEGMGRSQQHGYAEQDVSVEEANDCERDHRIPGQHVPLNANVHDESFLGASSTFLNKKNLDLTVL